MFKGVTFDISRSAVKIKSISQVLNSMTRRKVFANEEGFIQSYVMRRHISVLAASYTYDEISNERVNYLNKLHKIQIPRDFKEMKKIFSEYLLTTKEEVPTDSNSDDHQITVGNNEIRVNLENLRQGIEDAAAKLDDEYTMSSNSLVLFPLKPRTWCLLDVEAWSIVYTIKVKEGDILGISPLPNRFKSWVIIEVERASVPSRLSSCVRGSYD
jgi:hypothetical protein